MALERCVSTWAIGNHKLLFTLDDAHNTPDGLALAPNGVDYDSKDNFYTDSFGDGRLYKVVLNPDVSFASQEVLTPKCKQIPCGDGLIIDCARDKMDLCNSHQNAIKIINLRNDNAVTILTQNDDTDGICGLLDQPDQVLLYCKRLRILNFDKLEKYFVNSKSVVPHAMLVVDLPPAARELTSPIVPPPKKRKNRKCS